MENDLALAVEAALAAGKLLRDNFGKSHVVDEALHHDLKLALDKESQDLITKILLSARPTDALYGEEGIAGNQDSGRQWIVDPIDGTVNFFYGIPHFCVSIALRVDDEVVLGVIHDPMVGETWTIEKGGVPLLNGEPVTCSTRTQLEEAILFVGCGKDTEAMTTGIERFKRASLRARKMRMMGSAALGMAYICCGRLDAYVESTISLWDIAAGKLLVEAAGGKVTLTLKPGKSDVYSIVTTNGKIPIEEIL
ncbi:MAG: inositol monophosphatase [Akkermansiaceae bacterium]|jgi:myo-inositol-1(or 4)-monophosphatase|nr:inositol monophosphatase [Akkermansiaceae bacterium]MDP4645606.1 inositol monophosphatase [Akkermansiaceae bacterium]MDP4719969.1 inositol monophosphatase [Akkermansiaceae bacterium]MDP4780830.1 inositol monophosphatase [Akkermansiaceae bacterium]MDP4848404.1 inositol monophosphatase [Akkermansiaceae bacterium]